MNKQETSALRREASKLRRNLEGIMDMDRLPDARSHRHQSRGDRGRRSRPPENSGGGHCRYNCDPEKIEYPIAGNDDAIRLIRVILRSS